MPRLELVAGWLVLFLSGGSSFFFAAEHSVAKAARTSAWYQKVAATVEREVHLGLGGDSAGSHIQVLDESLSLPPGAELHVTSVRAGYSPGSWLLRMDCSSRRDCLPFHVVLRSPSASLRDQVAADPIAPAAGGDKSGPSMRKLKRPSSPVTRSGDRVVLVEERSGMRLKVPGVCLQSGGLGDAIRVQNLATRRILLATVAGKNLVRVE